MFVTLVAVTAALFYLASYLHLSLYLCFTFTFVYTLGLHLAASYTEFRSLGPGGNSGFVGFLNVTWQRLLKHRDVLAAPEVPLLLHPQAGVLAGKLPPRRGARPLVLGIAPQRQVDNLPSHPKEMYCRTNAGLQRLIDKWPAYLVRDHSIPYYGVSLFGLNNDQNRKTFRFSQAEFHYDIGHVHQKDGSLHFNLHPADVAEVIRFGYGERHGISRSEWWWRSFWIRVVGKHRAALLPDFGLLGRVPTPPGFAFVYTPRDEEEVEAVIDIAKAAIWWVTNVPQDIGRGCR